MEITFYTDVRFDRGAIVNSEAVADLRQQGVVGDVQVTHMVGLKNGHPQIHRGNIKYTAHPYPLDFEPVEVADD